MTRQNASTINDGGFDGTVSIARWYWDDNYRISKSVANVYEEGVKYQLLLGYWIEKHPGPNIVAGDYRVGEWDPKLWDADGTVYPTLDDAEAKVERLIAALTEGAPR
jgi:hypothetical protein